VLSTPIKRGLYWDESSDEEEDREDHKRICLFDNEDEHDEEDQEAIDYFRSMAQADRPEDCHHYDYWNYIYLHGKYRRKDDSEVLTEDEYIRWNYY